MKQEEVRGWKWVFGEGGKFGTQAMAGYGLEYESFNQPQVGTCENIFNLEYFVCWFWM